MRRIRQSRILDSDNQIIRLVNNYTKISFNFGPTLLSWLEAKAPEVYEAILEADRESRNSFPDTALRWPRSTIT